MNTRGKTSAYALAMMGMLLGIPGLENFGPCIDTKKPMKKCLLKSCNRLTNHNGGYCCAEHCKEDNRKS